ncbi:MAG: SH3 domain-containing protein [Saprospiraceae bacterium]|nr:SH3 domain-containing protein [Saprospiraceae bacterium]
MKTILCILLISMSAVTIQAQEIHVFEKENVFATSGIKLRATPSQTGQVIKIIPFGESFSVLENTEQAQSIEWMDGTWIKGQYQGLEGYIFDGFTSSLPVPTLDFELTQEDLDLSYPLLAWAEYHFDPVRTNDTVQTNHAFVMTQHLENGIRVQREESDYHFKVEVIMPNTDISDVFILLRSMLLTKLERQAFNHSAVYILNDKGWVDQIKIDLDNPVEIKSLADGSVKISVVTFHEGCSL